MYHLVQIILRAPPSVDTKGFDDLMPLERGFPRFIPRFFGTKLKIIIGASITSKVAPLIEEYHEKAGGPYSKFSNTPSSSFSTTTASPSATSPSSHIPPTLANIAVTESITARLARRPKPPYYEGDSEDAKRIRIEIAKVLKEEVEKLGRKSREMGKAEGLEFGKHEITS